MIEQFWLFHCGYFRAPESILTAGAPHKIRATPFMGAMLVHPEHGPILIDAPFGHEGVNSVGVIFGSILKVFGVRTKREWSVVERVRECGFRAAEVNHVLMTHLHSDHTGGMKEFAHAKFHMNEKEWEFAQTGSLTQGYVVEDYRALQNIETFSEASHDVFGDGSVEARWTPGHSTGHTSYRVTLKTGMVIEFLGDAAFSVSQIEESRDFGAFPETRRIRRRPRSRDVDHFERRGCRTT